MTDAAAAWARVLAAGDHRAPLPELVAAIDAAAAAAEDTPLVEAAVGAWVAGEAAVATTVAFAPDGPLRGAAAGLGEPLPALLRAVPWARGAERLVVMGADGAVVVDLASAAIQPGSNVAEEPRDRVTLNGAEVVTLPDVPPRDEVVARLGLLRAVAQAGAARAAHEMTRAHVRTREQFGAPLIELPAVATNLAVMRTELIQAEAGLARARDAFAAGRPVEERLDAVAVARVSGATAATTIARLAHQLHGARGVTAAHPLHRLTRRLWAWRDAEVPEREWARRLGARAAVGGETVLWEELTSADPG